MPGAAGLLLDAADPSEALARAGSHLVLGRQPIFTVAGEIHGYELLYRTGQGHACAVNHWQWQDQDQATLTVLEAAFSSCGVRTVAADALVFVNFTRSFLTAELPIPPVPSRLVVEVVESVRADAAVVEGIEDLRAAGFRIALDDFAGLDDQLALLPWADYVKIDLRDLDRCGARLVDIAAGHGATLVAERVETQAQLEECEALGFSLFQGNHLRAAEVLRRTTVPGTPWPTAEDIATAHRLGTPTVFASGSVAGRPLNALPVPRTA